MVHPLKENELGASWKLFQLSNIFFLLGCDVMKIAINLAKFR